MTYTLVSLALRFVLFRNKQNFDNQVEQFSTECCKTKTKVIMLANHKRHKQHNEPIKS